VANTEALPRGIVAIATPLASSQGSVPTSLTDVTGQSLTWTASSSRRYIIFAQASHFSSGGAAAAAVAITTSANVEVATSAGESNGGYYQTQTLVAHITGVSGSVTYKMRAQAIGSAGQTITILGDSASTAYSTQLYVLDAGEA
jgi:hypothetical protein